MKILITGGHMTPALALIQALPKDAEVVYVGRKHTFEGDEGLSLEYRTIREAGIPFIHLAAGRLQRNFSRHTLPSLLKFPLGIKQALQIVNKEKPDVVVGFGGYLSLAVGIAAFIKKIPLLIHEQTMHAGFSNKILGRFATKVAISWKSSEKYFPKNKIVLTGNPQMISYPTQEIQKLMRSLIKKPLLVITGGSGGSHAINVLIEQILPQLLEKYTLIHQTGDATEFGDYDRLESLKKSLPKELQQKYHLMKFIDPSDIEFVYAHADLVVSRSGINTVTLLLLLKKHALLIPLESGQKNEQATNAKFLQKIGLAEVVSQHTHPQNLLVHIEAMMSNRKKNASSEAGEYASEHRQAASRLVELLYAISATFSKKS